LTLYNSQLYFHDRSDRRRRLWCCQRFGLLCPGCDTNNPTAANMALVVFFIFRPGILLSLSSLLTSGIFSSHAQLISSGRRFQY
jgi:hypothetical protein